MIFKKIKNFKKPTRKFRIACMSVVFALYVLAVLAAFYAYLL